MRKHSVDEGSDVILDASLRHAASVNTGLAQRMPSTTGNRLHAGPPRRKLVPAVDRVEGGSDDNEKRVRNILHKRRRVLISTPVPVAFDMLPRPCGTAAGSADAGAEKGTTFSLRLLLLHHLHARRAAAAQRLPMPRLPRRLFQRAPIVRAGVLLLQMLLLPPRLPLPLALFGGFAASLSSLGTPNVDSSGKPLATVLAHLVRRAEMMGVSASIVAIAAFALRIAKTVARALGGSAPPSALRLAAPRHRGHHPHCATGGGAGGLDGGNVARIRTMRARH